MSKMVRTAEPDFDAVFNGKAYGDSAKRLMATGFNVNALRTNDLLRKDEWKDLDTTVVQIARQRLVGANDLISRGLFYNVPNGLGTTVLEYEDVSDMTDANMNMDAVTPGQEDRLEYGISQLPLPVIHKDFRVSIRVLEASRRRGTPIDTTQAGVAARKVAEKVETILFTGASTYTFGGGVVYGYTDHPSRNTVTLVEQWTASACTGEDILDDVLAMKQASINDGHYGPWILYVPTAYETTLDEDFKANSDDTIRERILSVAGIQDVKVADKLTNHNVILVQLLPETARMVIGMQPTTLEWSTNGGLISHFKVMTIMVPQLRADQEGKMGLVHLS